MQTIQGFGTFYELHPFAYQLFVVSSIHPKAHTAVCAVRNGVEGKCAELFSKYYTKSHFLIGNEMYVYIEENILIEYLY